MLAGNVGEGLDASGVPADTGVRLVPAGETPHGFPLLVNDATGATAGDGWAATGTTRGATATPAPATPAAFPPAADGARGGDTPVAFDFAAILPTEAGPDSLAHSTTDEPAPPPGGVAAAAAAAPDAAGVAPPPPTAATSRWPFFRFASFAPGGPAPAPALPRTTTQGSSLSSSLLPPPLPPKPPLLLCALEPPTREAVEALTSAGAAATVDGDFDPLACCWRLPDLFCFDSPPRDERFGCCFCCPPPPVVCESNESLATEIDAGAAVACLLPLFRVRVGLTAGSAVEVAVAPVALLAGPATALTAAVTAAAVALIKAAADEALLLLLPLGREAMFRVCLVGDDGLYSSSLLLSVDALLCDSFPLSLPV